MTHLLYFVMLPILVGLILFIAKRWVSRALSVVVQVYLLALSLYYVFSIGSSELLMPLINVPLPYGMALGIDRLSAIMLLLSNFLFCVMIIFSFHKPFMNRLFIFLFLSLQGLINGMFLSTDFFNVYILIEVATVTVSVLIMYKKDSQSMYDGMIYLVVNMVAMTFFLFGVGYLYKHFGVLDFVSVKAGIESVSDPRMIILPFAFLLTGVGLKAAIMPLFSWLPKAHGTASAPSIVSAILSGIFVKAGIYLLIRMQLIFSSAIDMSQLLLILGFMTALSGFIFAMSQSDIKLILAYHTISQVGLILVGISGPYGYNPAGGVYHILAHGVFKSLLFLIAGLMTHHYKTRKIHKMRDLWHANRGLSIALLIAVFSITGAPFFSGGFSKYFISGGYETRVIGFLFWLINIGTMTSFIKFFRAIFYKSSDPVQPLVLKPNESFVLGVMSGICFLLGFGGSLVMKTVLNEPFAYSPLSQLSKLPIYVATYAFSVALYRFVLEDSKPLRSLKKLELTFNSISIAIVMFFFFTITYLNLTMA